MEQNPVKHQTTSAVDLKSLEEGLQILWERVRSAGDAVVGLRADKAALVDQISALETQVRILQAEIKEKDEQLRSLASERTRIKEKENTFFANGEREVIETRLRDLLSRLEAYL